MYWEMRIPTIALHISQILTNVHTSIHINDFVHFMPIAIVFTHRKCLSGPLKFDPCFSTVQGRSMHIFQALNRIETEEMGFNI